MDSNCIFCQIVKKESPAYIIYEDANYISFLNIHPVNPGHALVIPKRHSHDITQATPADRDGLLEVVMKVVPVILKAVDSHSFNIGINMGKPAGQTVFHTHMHIIPRTEKDQLPNWSSNPVHAKELLRIQEKILPFL